MALLERKGGITRRDLLIAFGSSVVAYLLTRCGLLPKEKLQQFTITAKEFSFDPSILNFSINVPAVLFLINKGILDHDLKSDIPIKDLSYISADNDPDEQKDNAEKNVLDVDFNASHASSVKFTPVKAGSYEFYCDVDGHKEAGMKGTFNVI